MRLSIFNRNLQRVRKTCTIDVYIITAIGTSAPTIKLHLAFLFAIRKNFCRTGTGQICRTIKLENYNNITLAVSINSNVKSAFISPGLSITYFYCSGSAGSLNILRTIENKRIRESDKHAQEQAYRLKREATRIATRHQY